MRVRHAVVMGAAFAVVGGALIAPGTALAGPPALPVSARTVVTAFPAADPDADAAAAEREFVLWVAQTDERALVRSAAWAAVTNSAGDEAIRRFLESEYDYAEQLAEGRRARNKDFVAYVIATCVPAYTPEVCVAARRAGTGSDADREAFVLTGHAAAKQRDRQVRDAKGQQAAALRHTERVFVAGLRDNDPGVQVRAAAAWALRDGALDGDLVEFFTHGWGHAAGLDVRTHRTALADNDVAWRNTTRRLLAQAQAAEKAARDLAGGAGVQARAAAARAWATVGQQSGPARVAWAQAQHVALAQADAWQTIAAAAAASNSATWTPICGSAAQLRMQWVAEQQHSTVQAAYWTGLY